jgi:hypothetical protein
MSAEDMFESFENLGYTACIYQYFLKIITDVCEK